MIITVEGKIGSGKTYWAVNFLIEKFFVWKDELFTYVPKGNLRVISNIKELAIPHIDLDEEIQLRGGIERVFTVDYPGIKDANTSTIFVIDEAQSPEYFHRKYYNPAVFLFFQKSRHLGIDVVLITQDRFTLCKEIQVLSEYNVIAVPRSVRTKNVFMYKYMHGNEVGRRKSIIFNKRIAALYRSFEKLENEKVRYLWKKYAIGVVVAFIVVMVGFKLAMSSFFGNSSSVSPAVGASSPASTKTAASESGSNLKAYQDLWKQKNALAPDPKTTTYRADGKPPEKVASIQPGQNVSDQKAPDGSAGSGIVKQGEDEKEVREPLVPMKCQPPDDRGWQECFEGQKYVGRMKVFVSSSPEYGKSPR